MVLQETNKTYLLKHADRNNVELPQSAEVHWRAFHDGCYVGGDALFIRHQINSGIISTTAEMNALRP